MTPMSPLAIFSAVERCLATLLATRANSQALRWSGTALGAARKPGVSQAPIPVPQGVFLFIVLPNSSGCKIPGKHNPIDAVIDAAGRFKGFAETRIAIGVVVRRYLYEFLLSFRQRWAFFQLFPYKFPSNWRPVLLLLTGVGAKFQKSILDRLQPKSLEVSCFFRRCPIGHRGVTDRAPRSGTESTNSEPGAVGVERPSRGGQTIRMDQMGAHGFGDVFRGQALLVVEEIFQAHGTLRVVTSVRVMMFV